jgi:hypothetical protein
MHRELEQSGKRTLHQASPWTELYLIISNNVGDHIRSWSTTRKIRSFWTYLCQFQKLVTAAERRGILPFLFQRKENNPLPRLWSRSKVTSIFSLPSFWWLLPHGSVIWSWKKRITFLRSQTNGKRCRTFTSIISMSYTSKERKISWHSFLFLVWRVRRNVFGESNRYKGEIDAFGADNFIDQSNSI